MPPRTVRVSARLLEALVTIATALGTDSEMANIDKKLAKKLAKMPEEERQTFLENLRLQEEENQRKKEEMLLRFLKVRNGRPRKEI